MVETIAASWGIPDRGNDPPERPDPPSRPQAAGQRCHLKSGRDALPWPIHGTGALAARPETGDDITKQRR